jgi:hypothetical protein
MDREIHNRHAQLMNKPVILQQLLMQLLCVLACRKPFPQPYSFIVVSRYYEARIRQKLIQQLLILECMDNKFSAFCTPLRRYAQSSQGTSPAKFPFDDE